MSVLHIFMACYSLRVVSLNDLVPVELLQKHCHSKLYLYRCRSEGKDFISSTHGRPPIQIHCYVRVSFIDVLGDTHWRLSGNGDK